MSYEVIRYEVADRIATITMDRPERLNAFTPLMQREMVDAIDRADRDGEVRVVVVTGAGRGYCAGADMAGGEGTFDHGASPGPDQGDQVHRDEGGLLALRIFDCDKPVIGAINGPAVGVGVTSTLPMDIRLAAESARFGFVFTRRGIVPEACSTWFLPKLVGISRAAEWTYTGRIFDAAEALEAGLVRSVHPDDELMDATYALAREICAHTSAVSVALTRAMLWRLPSEHHPMAAHRLDSLAVDALGRSDDAHEGVRSFLDKRPPAFTSSVPDDLPPWYPWWDQPSY